MKIILAIIIGILIASAVDAQNTHFNRLSDYQASRIILGEAAGEVYAGKLAVACVLRNRGSAQGFEGNKRTKAWYQEQGQKAQADSLRAWHESANFDVTHGCNLVGGLIDDWYFINKLHLKPVLTIGNQRFFKSK